MPISKDLSPRWYAPESGRQGGAGLSSSGWGARGLAVALCMLVVATGSGFGAATSRDHKSFASLITRLSEPGGFFDSDNLISNETSYLHVLGKLRELGVHGGVYIGVGPDQNFSYIARIRPRMAIIIDIR